MTYEKQDILEHFYTGNSKIIRVTVYNQDAEPLEDPLKNLEDCELTYVIMERDNHAKLRLRKSSNNGPSEIKIVSKGLCEIYLNPPDTINLYGKFRHHLNIVDENGKEGTAFTGLVEIHRTQAIRFREKSIHAFLEGNN